MKKIHRIIYLIICFLEHLCTVIFIKDPCKGNKCLVKACCSQACDEKLHYQCFFDTEGSIIFLKICAISIVLSFSSLVIVLVKKLI